MYELVNETEMLKKAKDGHYAVGQFSIYNLEWTKAVLCKAQDLNSPVILGVSKGAAKYMVGYKTVVGMVEGIMKEEKITVPVALHMEQGSYDECLKGIEAGFSSVMFDMAHSMVVEEEFIKIKKLVKLTREHGVSLEVEIGYVNSEGAFSQCMDIANKMHNNLGVDFLAVGIENIADIDQGTWKNLIFSNLCDIRKNAGDVPLVLQSDARISVEEVKKAIDIGVSKITVNKECQLSFAYAIRRYIEEGKDEQGKGYDLRKLLAPGLEEIKTTVAEKMEILGSVGKA